MVNTTVVFWGISIYNAGCNSLWSDINEQDFCHHVASFVGSYLEQRSDDVCGSSSDNGGSAVAMQMLVLPLVALMLVLALMAIATLVVLTMVCPTVPE